MKVVHPGLAWETVGCPPSVTQTGAPNEHPQECAVDAARACPRESGGRLMLVEGITEAGWSVVQAAQAAGISVRQSHRWLARYRAEGPAGLAFPSSAPARRPHRVSHA